MKVALVDYGAGNLTSVVKALEAVGATIDLVSEAPALAEARAIVIPGVGHFAATASLGGAWMTDVRLAINRGVPLLGICLGLQWLFDGSAESPETPGLGFFRGRCFNLKETGSRSSDVKETGSRSGDVKETGSRSSDSARPGLLDTRYKVPHVGWNTLDRTDRPSRLLDGIPNGASAYFTHSYAAPLVAETVATTMHAQPFSAAVERDRVFGVQFHPEKSGATGLRMLTNFMQLAADRR